MYCKKCGNEVSDDAVFCSKCGCKLQEESLGGDGGENNDNKENNESKTANAEGADGVNGENSDFAEDKNGEDIKEKEENRENNENNGVKGNKKKKIIIAAAAAVIVVAIIAAGAFALINRPKNGDPAPVVYASDDELYVITALGSEEADTFRVSDDYAGTYQLSEDCKYIVYGENRDSFDDDGDGVADRYTFDLLRKKIGDENNEGQLIAKNADEIVSVMDFGDKIIYEKNDSVYMYDAQGGGENDSEKIVKDASVEKIVDENTLICENYRIEQNEESDDFGRGFYEVSVCTVADADCVKIDENITKYDVADDNSAIYFLKGGSLYKAQLNGEKDKIVEEADDFVINGSDIYFTKKANEYTYYSFVNDPKASSDGNAKEPVWEDYMPDESDYEYEDYDPFWDYYYQNVDYEGYYDALDKAFDKFDSDYENYENAKNRAAVRENLNESSGYSSYTLFWYDGKEAKEIAHNLTDDGVTAVTNGKGVNSSYVKATVYATPLDELSKKDMSEDLSSGGIAEYLAGAIKYNSIIVNKNDVVSLDLASNDKYLADILYNENAAQFVLLCGSLEAEASENSENIGKIYTLAEGEKSFEKTVLIAENACAAIPFNNNMLIFTDYNDKNRSGTISPDGKAITDVFTGWIMYDPAEENAFYYAADYNTNTGMATIYKYQNGVAAKICDEAMFGWKTFGIYDGKYLVMKDYDTDDYEGDLFCVDGEKSYKIDSGISYFDNGGLALGYGIGV